MTAAENTSRVPYRGLVLATSVILGAAGIGLIFAPQEAALALDMPGPGPAVILQLYGATLFGLAMTGWMVRGAVVGGIFGRSYVVGNTAHAVVGAFALTRPASAHGAPLVLVLAAAAYWLLALGFGYLMFVASP